MTGEETELDVVPLLMRMEIHSRQLIRNAADHGLESNEERIALGKPEVSATFSSMHIRMAIMLLLRSAMMVPA